MDWFWLTLLSAFCIASADAWSKKLYPGHSAMELLVLRLGAAGILLTPFALLWSVPGMPAEVWWWMLLLVPLEAGAMLLYVTAIRDTPLHLTLPYLAFTPAINILSGYLVLGETVTLRGFLGIALIVGGTYWLNMEHVRSRWQQAWWSPLLAIAHERGSRIMLAVAVIYSLTSVGSKAALLHSSPDVFGVFYYAVVGMATIVVAAIVRPASLGVLIRRPGPLLLIGVLMAVMVVAHFMAIAQVEAAYMVAVKRTSLLMGIVYGIWLFGEHRAIQNLMAGSLVVAGVGLIIL